MSKDDLSTLLTGPRDKDTFVVLYAPWCQFSQGLEPAFAELAEELSSDSMVFAKFQV